MKIGLPKELKTLEGRVGLTPEACSSLVEKGHTVFVESNAGLLSGYADDEYRSMGCHIAASAERLYQESCLIVKVKEPVAADLKHLQAHHIVFSFLHLAANKPLVDQLLAIGCTAIAFESVVIEPNLRPILGSMSHIAGRLAVQIGAHLLHQPLGGRGLLLGGVSNAETGCVVVVGAGQAGMQAAMIASEIGAEVTVFDLDAEKLKQLNRVKPAIHTRQYEPLVLKEAIAQADLVVGAVLVPDKHAPKIITEEMVKGMNKGTVIVDIAIDQGGCVETMQATNYKSPTFVKHGVIHFGVTNMPGAVPRTASQVLSAVISPFVHEIAASSGQFSDIITNAINIQAGEIVHPALVEEFSGIEQQNK